MIDNALIYRYWRKHSPFLLVVPAYTGSKNKSAMRPIFYTIGMQLPLMIIPNTEAHLDGHTIITRTYFIFKHIADADTIQPHESILKIDNSKNPNYMGSIVFDIPGRVYSYTPDGNIKLSTDEVEEIIEHLNHYRDNPSLWPK